MPTDIYNRSGEVVAQFEGVRLFRDCDDCSDTSYTDLVLSGIGVEADLVRSTFDHCDLSHAIVRGNVDNSTFYACDMVSTKFRTEVGDATFTECDMREAKFTGNLGDTSFIECDLRCARFVDCDLSEVTFENCIMRGADFSGATWGNDTAPDGWAVNDDGCLTEECQCGRRRVPMACGSCERCCDHRECGDCGEHEATFCSDCDNCECACSCNDGSSETEVSRTWVDKGHRLVGVEWEHNQRQDLDRWLTKWGGGYHSDGSCGWEAVTPPIAGRHIEPCLRQLGDALAESRIDATCGIHVHVDARDLRWADMYRLLYVYARVEPMLYLLGGQQRVANRYAAPCGASVIKALASLDRKGAILGVMLDTSNVDARSQMKRIGKKHSGRYKGLNIMPWLAGRKHKAADTTVEFRIHANEEDADRVIHWVRVCEALVSWCATHTDADALALPRSALRALVAIVGDSEKKWVMRRVAGWRRVTSTTGERTPRRIRVSKGEWSCAV